MSHKKQQGINATSINHEQVTKRGRTEVDDDDHPNVSAMNSEIKEMLLSLSKKMDTLQDSMSDIDIKLNKKIENLEGTMSSRINEVKLELEKRIETVNNNTKQQLANADAEAKLTCDRIATGAMAKVLERVDELRMHHEGRIDRLERYSMEKDIIISGIPMDSNDEPFAILGDICNALNCRLKPDDFSSAFRLRNTGSKSKNSRSVPIVARVQDEWAKQEIMGAYFKKKNLNLKDIGFKTGTRIYINERLTSTNREIFNRANEAKKAKFIYRFYTRRGLVHIQQRENDRPSCVFHVSDLDAVFPSNYDRHRQSGQRSMNESTTKPTTSPMHHNPSQNFNVAPTNATESMDTGQSPTTQPDAVHSNLQGQML